MAGTFTADLLADGQLPAAKAAIYTVPGSTVAYVRTIKLYNTNAATQTILVYINGGTSRKQYRCVLAVNESAEIDDRLTLGAADTIEAESTNAASVDYTVHGVEET
jgi:hypothetical protein